MIIKRSTLMLLLLAAAASVSLFVIKYRVQDLDDQMRDLSREIVETQENIHVLKSEWAHLNQPARLRQLAGKYLEVGPLDAERIGGAARLIDTLPDRAAETPAEADPSVKEAAQ